MRLVVLLVLLGLATTAAATSIKVSDAASGVTILSQDPQGISVRVNVGELNLTPVGTKGGQFTMLTADGLTKSFNIGEPDLPVANQLIAVPEGAVMKSEILSSVVEEYDLSAYGISERIIPAQPSLSKSDDPAMVPFELNEAVYQQPGYYNLPNVTTEVSGEMRGLRVGLISVAPIQYNPVSNKLRVQKELVVRVSFENADWAATESKYENYYSPAFEPAYEMLGNYKLMGFGEKTDLTKYPIKMVIVSARTFEAQLQPFIAWKIQKGYKVIVAYTDVIGSTTTAIKAYLQGLYTAGTPADPAPSFVLFVGDTPQIPAFSGSSGSHVTDLRYCEYTGDNLPEVYYGRFSAQNSTELQPQIDKTLEYEKYLMPNPAYLGEATLIAGVDASYAPTYGNGQINYGTNLYFNAAHSITPHVWLYPASDGAGASAAVIATVNSGIGFINYTAHGSHDGWADPSFTVSNINSLTNAHKYGLSIGNCCLTNTFNESTPCYGEAWMQAANKGGIGYIGASNNSYWDEDYWWGVGGGKAIVAAGPAYDATKLGAYDGTFHDHGEPTSSHYVTNFAMNMCGNLAVEQSTSSRKTYYWEIYHLMGDPSVSTYMKVPTANSVSYPSSLLMTSTTLTVSAVPGSYVGLSYNGVLYGAGYVDQSGSVTLNVTPFASPVTASVVVTAQNRIPYIGTIQVIAPEGPYVIYQNHTIDDASGNNNGMVDFGEAISLGMQLQNVGPDAANNVVATLTTDDVDVTITDATESYGTIAGNFGTSNIPGAFAFTVSPTIADGHKVTFTVTVTGTQKDTWVSTFNVTAHAPTLGYVSFAVSDLSGNNNGVFDPGETVDMTVTLNNSGSGTAYNVLATLSELDTYVDITDADGAYGTIAGSSSATNSSNKFTLSASSSCPMGHGLNCKLSVTGDAGYTTALYFTVTVGDRVVFFLEDFTAEQGWTGLGGAAEWQIAAAVGGTGGTGNADPAQDHSASSDNMLLGNDLTSSGSYSASISSTQWVYSPIIDCSNATGVIMDYFHQLNSEDAAYDHVYLQVYNGTEWVQLFTNGTEDINESGWNASSYDLAAVADNNPDFQIRFGLGPTDGSVQYNGWNIDDISLKGYISSSGGSSYAQITPMAIADSLVEGEQAVQHVMVKNTGEATLRIRFTPGASWMTCATTNNMIAIGDSLDFAVTFNATGLTPGSHPAQLAYTSNDPLHASGNVNADLFVHSPLMGVNPGSITKNVPLLGRDSVSFAINNTGDGKLTFAIDCDDYVKAPFAKPAPVNPIGYRVDDPEKGGVEEPIFPDVTKGFGGPDAAGNIWIDSDDPNGPTYNWIDIAASGTEITGLDDDNFVGPFPIGFAFPFYGANYTEFWVSSNGYIGFGPSTDYSARNNVTIPTAATPNNFVAWCFDDLNIDDVDSPGGQVRYQVVNGELVVSFINYPEYESATNPGDVITAQIILAPMGEIRIQYQSIAAGFDILGCTVGVENATGTDGLQVVYNANYLHNQLAVRFGPQAPTWLNVSCAGGTLQPHTSMNMWVYFDALEMPDTTCAGSMTITSNDPAHPTLAVPVTMNVGVTYMPGDADNNQIVNISDAVYIIQYVFSGGPAPNPLEAGDADCNAIVNISDVVYLISYIFSGGPDPCQPVK